MTIPDSGLLFWGHPVYLRQMAASHTGKAQCIEHIHTHKNSKIT